MLLHAWLCSLPTVGVVIPPYQAAALRSPGTACSVAVAGSQGQLIGATRSSLLSSAASVGRREAV